jgi:hypothetical protein
MSRNGKQYVVIAAGGPAHLRTVGDTSRDNADSLIAFTLSQQPVITERQPEVRAGPSRASMAPANAELPEAAGKM